MPIKAAPEEVRPALVPVNENSTLLWGMDARERLRRLALSRGLDFDVDRPDRPTILANLHYVFDPSWLAWLERHPQTIVTRDGVPVLAHVPPSGREALQRAMEDGAPVRTSLDVVASEREEGIFNEALRKRERPFAERLVPEAVPAIERATYVGAYKGVTDVLTKYLWPEWAFVLTRLAARVGISPNGVTAVGSLLCIAATLAFWHGWFWSGLAVGLVFMVLDTVDGKLARCTVTSSPLGNAWDHGVDLVHPPFWWWAWAAGCAPYGRALSDRTFWAVMAAMLVGYVAQRLIEGAFIVRFHMHIHVWRRFDSWFRLFTARRNPNMVILFGMLLIGRPDWGIVGVAVWTIMSLLVHLVRLGQAMVDSRRGEPVASWLA